MAKTRFILSTESINRHGYRVMTNGIDLDRFRKNPVMFYQHNQYNAPIGRWEDIKVESDGTLTAMPVFDVKDALGAEIKRKVDEGFLFAASCHFKSMIWTDEKAFLLQGQTRKTLLKSELLEASIVNIPGQADAVKLSATDGNETIIPKLKNSIMDYSKIALALGLNSDASETEILAFITEQEAKSKAETVLQLGVDKGVVTEKNREHYLALAMANPSAVENLFEQAVKPEAPISLSSQLNRKPTGKAGNERADWSFDTWSKKDPDGLLQLKLNEPDKYMELVGTLKMA